MTSTATPQVSRTWTYDLVGRPAGHTRTGADGDFSFGYDVAGNLTSIDHGGGLVARYVWDAQSRMTDASLELNTAVQGAAHIDYDTLGRRTSVGFGDGSSQGYSWELDGDLTAISHAYPGRPADNATFSYAHDRVGRVTTEQINHGSYDYQAQVATVAYGEATGVRTYVLGPLPDERLIYRAADGQVYYPHTDRRGSTVALSQGAAGQGQAVETYAYDEFGRSGATGTSGYPWRYTGQRLDPWTGTYHYKAREYSPQLGRFLQADPARFVDGPNVYAYVGNNPWNATDPTGLCVASRINVADGSICRDSADDQGTQQQSSAASAGAGSTTSSAKPPAPSTPTSVTVATVPISLSLGSVSNSGKASQALSVMAAALAGLNEQFNSGTLTSTEIVFLNSISAIHLTTGRSGVDNGIFYVSVREVAGNRDPIWWRSATIHDSGHQWLRNNGMPYTGVIVEFDLMKIQAGYLMRMGANSYANDVINRMNDPAAIQARINEPFTY